MKKIFLLGAYGQNNLGDDALLEAFLEQLRDARVVVSSAQPEQNRRRYGVEAVATHSGRPRLSWARALLTADVIVFGGGSLLKQTEGGFMSRLLYFLCIFILLGFGKLFGHPTAMLGVGIGPLAHPLYCRIARQAANLTDLICVRDNQSRDMLLALGVRRPIHVMADPAFTLAALDEPRGSALSGGALLFASMTIVNIGNYVFNLVLGRWLGPAAFADLSLIITLMLVITMITATLQTISAKFSAMYAADGDETRLHAVRTWLGRWAWVAGLVVLAAFALGAPIWRHFFQTASAWPFVILGIGLPLYFAQGVDRGVLQGRTNFGALSLSYQAEMWVRLAGAIAFVALGWSVNGAVAGVTLSLIAAWLVGFWILDVRFWTGHPTQSRTSKIQKHDRRAVIAFAGPVVAALVGQVLINNSDILIVKHFFSSAEAGQYAALALIGRIVFFATVSVVAAMFPIVAQKQQRGEPHRHLLWIALGLVATTSLAVIGAALVMPGLMVQLLFGAAYLPIAPLLWLYAVATMLYALANVVINYRLSAGDGGGSGLAILAGAAQAGGLWLFHGSLREVVAVQIVLMIGLFAALLVWDRRLAAKQANIGSSHHKGTQSTKDLKIFQIPTRRLALGGRRRRIIAVGGASLIVLLLMLTGYFAILFAHWYFVG